MSSFVTFLNQFTDVLAASMNVLLALFIPVQLKKHEYFAREEEYARKLAYGESGVLRAFSRNQKGEEFNKLFFVNPSIVGAYSSLITGEQNMINIQCLSNCTLLQASFQDILDLYEEYPLIEWLNRVIAEDFLLKKKSGKCRWY